MVESTHTDSGAQARAKSSRTWALVVALLAVTTLLKAYHLTCPALDWQSWNQISTLATARYIYRDGLSALWVPRVDLFTGLAVDSNKTFAEFPLLHLLMVAGYKVIGGEAEWVGRVWAILFSLAGGVYLARLAKRDLSDFAVVAAVAVYAFSPTNLYFHRTLQTDVPFTACMVVGLFYFVRWMDTDRLRDGIYAGVAIALAALFKAYALYMGASFLYLLVRRRGWRQVVTAQSLLVAAICVAPIAAWIAYGVTHFADKPGEARNLVSSANLLGPWSIVVNPQYWWQILQTWFQWTLTPFVWLAAAAGVIATIGWRIRRRDASQPAPIAWPDWLTAWWLGELVYLLIVRHGNWQHDYYQIPALEPLAITAALGLEYIWKRFVRRPSAGAARWPRTAFIALAVLSFTYAIVTARNKTAWEEDELSAGKAVAAIRQSGEYLLYWDLGGLRENQLLYYSGGPGWKMPPGISGWQDVRPYYELGGRYAVLNLRSDDWAAERPPLKAVREMVEERHLVPVAESDQQTDRYGRARHWVVYRVLP